MINGKPRIGSLVTETTTPCGHQIFPIFLKIYIIILKSKKEKTEIVYVLHFNKKKKR
jgi:hypothetical protein